MKFSHITYAPGYTTETHPNGTKSFTDEELIDAFFASYNFWVYGYGHRLINDANAGFAILLLMYPYFQMIGRYIEGQMSNDPKEFQIGFLNVFSKELTSEPINIQETIAYYLYKNLRCELAHGNLMGKGLILSDDNTPAIAWVFDTKKQTLEQIVVNPRLWVLQIGEHIKIFRLDLTSDIKKRQLFLKYAKSHLAKVTS